LTLDKFTYPTSTTGGHIAVGDISDRIKNMRRFRGEHVYPVITLSDTFMNTRFGGRQRPHFKIVRWVSFRGEGGQVALPPPEPAPQTTSQLELPLKEVKEPTIQEDMNDDLPDDLKADVKESIPKTAPPHPTARRNLKKPTKTGAKKPSPKRPSNVLDAG
jgi:hypothetical protein